MGVLVPEGEKDNPWQIQMKASQMPLDYSIMAEGAGNGGSFSKGIT